MESTYPILEEQNTVDYVEMVSRWLCNKYGCRRLLEDVKQDMYIEIMKVSKKKPNLAHHCVLYEAKYNVWDILRSKKYKETYGNAGFRKPTVLTWASMWGLSNNYCLTATDICNKVTLDTIPDILSERRSRALHESLVDKWTQSEIAEREGVSSSMISKEISAGIKILQEKWKITATGG